MSRVKGERLRPMLSIIIPTYNRCTKVVPLIYKILDMDSEVEVCAHDDGSTDATNIALSRINDRRFLLSSSSNCGRGHAIYCALQRASGEYVMIFDDDDDLYHRGLCEILENCERRVGPRLAGYIFHMEDHQGQKIGESFQTEVSNFLELRADHRVSGDKKEVVRRDLMLEAVQLNCMSRRVPTSLYWARIAIKYDIACRNVTVGKKTYEPDGMSSKIKAIKRNNPGPLLLLYQTWLKGFWCERYRSKKFLLGAFMKMFYYSVLIVEKNIKLKYFKE